MMGMVGYEIGQQTTDVVIHRPAISEEKYYTPSSNYEVLYILISVVILLIIIVAIKFFRCPVRAQPEIALRDL